MLMQRPVLIYADDELAPTAAEGQCDCACAPCTPHALPAPDHLSAAPYQINPDLVAVALKDDYTAYLSAHGARTVVLNQAARDLVATFTEPKPLMALPTPLVTSFGQAEVAAVVADLARLGILTSHAQPGLPLTEQSNTLNVWLHMTDRCNLRCTYCYLPHVQEDMSLEVGQAAVDAALRSAVIHHYPKVKLKYAGGEPLLRFPVVAELHTYAQRQAQQFGITVDGVVLSNGTLLTPQIVQRLKALSLRLMISLDGLGDAHDCQRAFAGGRGSSERVLQGIESALANQLTPDISITVTGRNAPDIANVVRWVIEHDLPFSLNFYRENNLSMAYTDLQLEESKIIAGMRHAFAVIEEYLPRRSVLGSIVDRANLQQPHLHTCAVGQNYLVFDYQGRVAKCQMQLGAHVTDHLAADPLALIQADKVGIQNLAAEQKAGCRDCEWKYWCTGGCALLTYRATGRYDVSSPNCQIYKALYPEAVKLEGLRLLKYYS